MGVAPIDKGLYRQPCDPQQPARLARRVDRGQQSPTDGFRYQVASERWQGRRASLAVVLHRHIRLARSQTRRSKQRRKITSPRPVADTCKATIEDHYGLTSRPYFYSIGHVAASASVQAVHQVPDDYGSKHSRARSSLRSGSLGQQQSIASCLGPDNLNRISRRVLRTLRRASIMDTGQVHLCEGLLETRRYRIERETAETSFRDSSSDECRSRRHSICGPKEINLGLYSPMALQRHHQSW